MKHNCIQQLNCFVLADKCYHLGQYSYYYLIVVVGRNAQLDVEVLDVLLAEVEAGPAHERLAHGGEGAVTAQDEVGRGAGHVGVPEHNGSV